MKLRFCHFFNSSCYFYRIIDLSLFFPSRQAAGKIARPIGVLCRPAYSTPGAIGKNDDITIHLQSTPSAWNPQRKVLAMDSTLEEPPIVYKYRAFNSNTLSCLVRDVIWFASPQTFNDPFDGWLALPKSDEARAYRSTFVIDSPTINLEATQNNSIPIDPDHESTRSAVGTFSKLSPDLLLQCEAEKKLKHRGILCVNTDPKNILMWSHYADQHRGLCIGYRFDYAKLREVALIRKVGYPESDDLEVLTANDLHDTDSSVEKLLLKKSRLWRYEGEWRFILKQTLSSSEPGREENLSQFGQVEEIIFGMRMRIDHRDVVAKVVGNTVSLKVAQPAYRRYQLDIREYRRK